MIPLRRTRLSLGAHQFHDIVVECVDQQKDIASGNYDGTHYCIYRK